MSAYNNLQNLITRLKGIEEHRKYIEPLLALRQDFANVVSFGCGAGYESLALRWCLPAREVVGVDINSSCISQARTTASNIFEHIEEVKRAWYRNELPESRVPTIREFLGRYENTHPPTFVTADITQGTSLPGDHFDLVFCRSVLYHIYCDNYRLGTEKILQAVTEIARVTKLGGIVVAIEPDTCSEHNQNPVLLDQFFEKVGLRTLAVNENQKLPYNAHLYEKPV